MRWRLVTWTPVIFSGFWSSPNTYRCLLFCFLGSPGENTERYLKQTFLHPFPFVLSAGLLLIIHPRKLTWQREKKPFEDVSPIKDGGFPFPILVFRGVFRPWFSGRDGSQQLRTQPRSPMALRLNSLATLFRLSSLTCRLATRTLHDTAPVRDPPVWQNNMDWRCKREFPPKISKSYSVVWFFNTHDFVIICSQGWFTRDSQGHGTPWWYSHTMGPISLGIRKWK